MSVGSHILRQIGSRSAAAYVRMSSDRQELSIGTQLVAIRAYAALHEYNLVHVYEDAAKSGLAISNRDGMKQLLCDVMTDPRPFDVVLVYDVSRWGRFQDIDAAAYYEYTCRLNGVNVIYVQEPFGADDAPMTALLKTLKRAMAAEYARELGLKCRAGQDRAIQLGFQMGQLPCLGLRRVAIDRDGGRRNLERGQGKANQTERIGWVPGPPEEVALVNRIFAMYAADGGTIKGTARQLQHEGLIAPSGRPYTTSMVDHLLRCEAFAGNFVWGKERYAAGAPTKKRPETRADCVIERVVPMDLWEMVQRKLWTRRRLRRDKEELLQILREKLKAHPDLSTLDLEELGVPSKKAYEKAFGSMTRALSLAGRDGALIRRRHEASKRRGRSVGDSLERDISELLEQAGIACHPHPRSRLLILEERLRMRLQLVWPRSKTLGRRWRVLKNRRPIADLVLMAQMGEGDYVKRFLLLSAEQYKGMAPWLPADLGAETDPISTSEELVARIKSQLSPPFAQT
ncbi:recombinase family protein [Hydrogenophaga sp. T2]|uniref:recombinase family protein n=1 Tax=Hydrogenophaga sp. T2 TaxID=3132823 RepID=UPI003CF63159